MNELINQIINSLSKDLLKKGFNGHCYIATEALYYLLSDKEKKNFTPATLKIKGTTHWFLKNIKTNEIIDPTKQQFNFELNYDKARNRFFLTNTPSKRTLILLNRIYEKNYN